MMLVEPLVPTAPSVDELVVDVEVEDEPAGALSRAVSVVFTWSYALCQSLSVVIS